MKKVDKSEAMRWKRGALNDCVFEYLEETSGKLVSVCLVHDDIGPDGWGVRTKCRTYQEERATGEIQKTYLHYRWMHFVLFLAIVFSLMGFVLTVVDVF